MAVNGVGPGTVRVGRFIGRVGVVTLPAIEVGLDLDARVVRRHVARLEHLGWLRRDPWVWGEGSIVWLTSAGINGVGLGGVRAPKVSAAKGQPGMTTITRGVWCAFTAARLERRGFRWMSARELEADEARWAVRHRHDYGYRNELPDFAVWWAGDGVPVAIVVEGMRRRDGRQRWRLEAWRDAISAGRYLSVQYDCTNESLAQWVTRLAKSVHLGDSAFLAVVQSGPEEIAKLTTADQTPKPLAQPQAEEPPPPTQPHLRLVEEPRAQVSISEPPPYVYGRVRLDEPPPPPPVETPEEYEARKQQYFEIFGHYDSFEPDKPRGRRRR